MLILGVEITPAYGQVLVMGVNAQDFPDWETGAESVVSTSEVVFIKTQSDADADAYLPCFCGLAASDDDRTLLGVLDLLDILEVERGRLREVAVTVLAKGAGSAVERRAGELVRGV